MHTHQQSEWGFVLVGSCRITAVDELGRNFVADVNQDEGRIFPKIFLTASRASMKAASF
jgi:oxalate decarboxylase